VPCSDILYPADGYNFAFQDVVTIFVAALNLNERSSDPVSNSNSYAPALPKAATRMYLQTHLPRAGPVYHHACFRPAHMDQAYPCRDHKPCESFGRLKAGTMLWADLLRVSIELYLPPYCIYQVGFRRCL
jgi:hypothetical protein